MAKFSPAVASPKPIIRGELTGHARIVKDIAADIHSHIQKWNNINIHGVSLLKNIATLKCDKSFPDGLQQICDDLETDVNQLNKIVCSLKQIAEQLRKVVELNHKKDKLFNSWPTKNFADVADLIYNSYQQEAIVKQAVLENVAHDHRDEFKMLHLAAWVHQPMIPYDLHKKLESMLTETGHRELNESFGM